MTAPVIPPGTPTITWLRDHCEDYTAGGIVTLRWQMAKAIRDFGLDAIFEKGLVRLRKLHGSGAAYERRRAAAERVDAVILAYHGRRRSPV